MQPPTIWTVGHSNHPLEVFISMLRESSIETVADVRRFPGSRRHTQFQRENLEPALSKAGIQYRHFPDLGGRRSKRAPDSPNRGWRIGAFNAYADHMLTEEFRVALAELEQLAARRKTAMMCAEAVPWRCHRRLIADALVARNWLVLDIYAAGRTKEHRMTEFARIQSGRVIYPASEESNDAD